jgi:hypothetical protein
MGGWSAQGHERFGVCQGQALFVLSRARWTDSLRQLFGFGRHYQHFCSFFCGSACALAEFHTPGSV